MDIKVANTPSIVRDAPIAEKQDVLRAPLEWKFGYFLVKRSFDLVFSVVMIMGVLSWLLPVLALLIKMDSRGPVFFLQKRIGKDGGPFTCYKLRTMIVNAGADEQPATEDDARITRLGRVLRKTHLDELPQLWNVFMGSMSIVGPRPYMLTDALTFSRMVPGHGYRNFVKPGITGMAQVKGLHGQGLVTDFPTVFWRYQWDAFYVRNAGFLLDMRIIRQTLVIFLTQRTSR